MRKDNYAAVVKPIMPRSATGRRRIRTVSAVFSVFGGFTRLDAHHIEAYFSLRSFRDPGMPTPPRRDAKSQALARDGALNPHPEAVHDPLFTSNPFFDPKDLVQVRYEMVRRHDAEGVSISDVATSFGVSRPTFYKAQSAVAASGLAGLVPRLRGPKGGHKISAEVVDFITNLKAEQPELTTPQCVAAINARFGIKVHRRSLERAMARKKKSRAPAR
jgi:transposase